MKFVKINKTKMIIFIDVYLHENKKIMI